MSVTGKSAAQSISITLNGDPYRIDGDPRLSALIENLKMKPARIAVELNREVVPRARYGEIILKEGDVLEIINFVGGG
jgi:sulfur carrier protein